MKIMKILNYFFCATLALSVVTSANSASFKKDDLKYWCNQAYVENFAKKLSIKFYEHCELNY